MIRSNLIINERYKTKEKIGVGGMAEVWLCNDLVLDREVALKFVREVYSNTDSKAIKILRDEARLGAKLIGHHNIVTIIDYGVYRDDATSVSLYYIVMEYVEGENLQEWIDKYSNKFDAKTIYNINLYIAWEICRAISYSHSKSILHRDIKPLNIFVSKMGHIKVGDFGISRFTEEATRTHTLWRANTPVYCSPEQWNDEKPTKKTDIYQIGCTLYQLFTGRLPYETKNLAGLMNAHLNKMPISPNKINNNISKELSDIIIKAIEKKGNDRAELWQINDVIIKEIAGEYDMEIDVHEKNNDFQKLVYKITDFGLEDLKGASCKFTLPDFSEALSETIQLILIGVENIKIYKTIEFNLKESALTSDT